MCRVVYEKYMYDALFINYLHTDGILLRLMR